MDPNSLCSGDSSNPAVSCCFCEFPFPALCEGCLLKHPMDTDFPQHFYLPLNAGQLIPTMQVKDQFRLSLYKLHSAYSALKTNDYEMALAEEQLEAARLEFQLQFTEELDTRCAAARRKLSGLRQGFKAELLSAFKEAVANSMKEWTPQPNSLADLIRNYDGTSSLIVFKGWAGKAKERLTEVFQIHMETSLPAFARFNIDEFGQQKEPISNELAAAKKLVEELQTKMEQLARKNDELQASNLQLRKTLAELTNTKETELSRLVKEKETLRCDSAAHTKRLTEQMDAQRATIKHLLDELERVRNLSVSAPLIVEPSEQDTLCYILPQINGNTLRCYNLLTGDTSTATLLTTFTDETVFCLLNEGLVLCVGGYNGSKALNTVYLLGLSTAKVTLQQSMLAARSMPGIIKHGSSAFVFGGSNARTLRSCEKFVIARRTWHALPNMQHERSWFSPIVVGNDIYLPDPGKSNRVLEIFNVRTEEFKALSVPLPSEFIYNVSVSFVVDGEMIIISDAGQMGKWRINAEPRIRVSSIKLNGVEAFTNISPMQAGRQVFWVQWESGNLAKFDLDSQSFLNLSNG